MPLRRSQRHVATRSFTPSTRRSTACTPCFAAVAPCCKTDVATRLIRVTGDCFRAERVPPPRFADVFATDFALGRLLFLLAFFRFVPLADLAAVFLPPARVRFDALVVLRTPLPDDFDAVAMIDSSEGRYETRVAQESGTAMSGRYCLTGRYGRDAAPIGACIECSRCRIGLSWRNAIATYRSRSLYPGHGADRRSGCLRS